MYKEHKVIYKRGIHPPREGQFFFSEPKRGAASRHVKGGGQKKVMTYDHRQAAFPFQRYFPPENLNCLIILDNNSGMLVFLY